MNAPTVRRTPTGTTILFIGTDAALLEGLAQTFSALGYLPRLTHSVAEALEGAAATPPLVIVAERQLVLGAPEVLRVPLVPGGALVVYRTARAPEAPLTPAVQRAGL